MRLLCCLHVLLFLSYQLSAQSPPPTNATSSLDTLLQDYSFRAFVRPRPRTGILYAATVPPSLTGIKISAMRLRSGSLRRRGVSSLKEFSIPTGVIVKPYVTRLVFVYQNLANFSRFYYPLSGYDYLAPVIGLLAYDARNLSAVNLPELDITASKDPIKIKFSDLVRIIPQGGSVECVSFDSRGEPSFKDSIGGNTCVTEKQGHFSVVVKSVASAPPSPAPPPASEERKKKRSESNSRTWITVGSVLGGLVLLGLLMFLVLRCRSYKKEEKMKEMERAGETGEALRMTQVGETRAPTATTTRTQPVLETEYAA